jgi:hypothetical protein
MVAPDTSPPSRLVDNAKFAVKHLTALTSLTDKRLIFVRGAQAMEVLDVEYEESWEEAPAVDDRYVSVVLDDGVVKFPGDEALVSDGGR